MDSEIYSGRGRKSACCSVSQIPGLEFSDTITARMLLSHTSGFPNLRWLNPDRKLNINFEPASRYAYSGEGIQLLQLVIETIVGRPLKDLMEERVFRPLNMSRTSMISEQRFEGNYANGYDEWGRSLGHQQRQSAAARARCRPLFVISRDSCRR